MASERHFPPLRKVRAAVGVGAAALLLSFTAQALAQPECSNGSGWIAVESAAHRLTFAPRPAPIPIGRHFRLDIRLCSAPGTVRRLRVDADMPAHRHGMNYRTTVKVLGPDRWQAEGLMFHMPGRWRFVFDLETAQGTQRLTHELDVE